MEFDCIVIGKGLIGAAAAKYVSLQGCSVAVIGPNEPLDIQEGIVFSSHYDQARIQRIIGTDAAWTLLNQQSANAYPSLQKESNITFHTPVGCLYVNPHGSDAYLERISKWSEQFKSSCSLFENGSILNKTFTDFNFPETSQGIFEDAPSGFINPRLLVKAQLEIFLKNKGVVVTDIADEITYENEAIKIGTKAGKTFRAKKVLIAAGAFTNSLNLLDKKLFFRLKSESTIWVRVSKEEATRLRKLPSLLYEINTPEIQNMYLMQPVQYPDGEYYLKMGGNMPEDIYFETLEDIQKWFRTADSSFNLSKLGQALTQIMPAIKTKECIAKKCIVTYTEHGKPYIGHVNGKGLYVAAGGNGYGPMSSDALGRIAAEVVTKNVFPKEYDERDFTPVFMG